jgi:Flp pilus assembly protein TadG
MALVTPLLLALMFATFEGGNYFYSEHVVEKAVRDGARYASRRSFSDYTGCSPSADVIAKTRSVTRTGQVTSGGPIRLAGWSADASVTVTVACDTSGNSYVGKGIYAGLTGGVPKVKVSATVPYSSLFYRVGLSNANTLSMFAQSEAAVMGI